MAEVRGLPFCEERPLPAGGLLVRLGGRARPATITREALRDIRRALASWEGRRELRWLAFASANPTTFLAGADFRELEALSPAEALGFAAFGQETLSLMRQSRLWLVAIVEGACMGGGLDFALACDYRIATPKARFAHPGTRLGFFTGWGGTSALPRLSGAGIPALLSGEVLAAKDALKLGWIEEVSSEPLSRTCRRARQSAAADLALIKQAARASALPLSLRIPFCRRLAEHARAARETQPPQRHKGLGGET
ncbi:MAG: enoyl-CoA hydratase/isomerase family protein [Acidobacteria bacterium]|nr:enoyl-CoA hydratase/isomerase family protein [Acidobacteriota bacterium]